MGGWEEGEDDEFPEDVYLSSFEFEAFLDDTSLGKYADLSVSDLRDDDTLWDDTEWPALMDERTPFDDPIGGRGPGPFDADYGLSVRQRWRRRIVRDEDTDGDPAGDPADVFGPGLSRHTWLWRTAEAELIALADAPVRMGDTAPILVAQAAEVMIATGPTALPGLVDAAVGFPMGDGLAVRRYVVGELEASLSPMVTMTDGPGESPGGGTADVVEELLARALVRADFDRLPGDLDALAGELLFKNGEAPAQLYDRVAEILAGLTTVPRDVTGPALEEAQRLVKDGLVPLGQCPEGRVVSTVAGWLAIGAGLACPPTVIAMIICLPSAPRTLIRSQTRALGPFGRYCAGDGGQVVSPWRSGGTVLVGRPGTGKTQLMIWLATTAPGAVVAGTPNVLDVYDFAARATDHDCLVFDPGGLLEGSAVPGIEVVRMDLFALVRDWDSAGTVAALMVEATRNHAGSRNDKFWETMSARMLRVFLFAAKAAGRPLAAALEWLEADKEAEREVIGILVKAGDDRATRSYASYMNLTSGNPRDSIMACAQGDLQAFANLSEEGEAFDFDRFVAGSGTLVMLADPTTSAACLGAVAMMTRQLIEARFRCFRRGRAGTPMLVFADEAARSPALSPILAEVLAVGPSRGVNLVAACQTLEQFEGIPGGALEITEAAAQTLMFTDSTPAHLLHIAPLLQHDTDADDARGLNPALLARPEEGVAHILEGSRLSQMRPHAANEIGLWRLCHLDAAFSRAGAAPIAYW